MITEQQLRVEEASELKLLIENTLLKDAVFTSWGERCKVNESINKLYKLAIEPREN